MMLSAPKLRRDLTFSRHDTSSGAFFVIKDPTTGNFYRVREAEQYIARQLDGATSVDTVRQRTQKHFEAELTDESLNAFIRTLASIGLLESEQTSHAGSTRRRRRTSGSLLYLRCKLCDPDKLLSWLEPRVTWLFTPAFLIASAALILAAVSITISGWDEYLANLRELYRVSAIPLFIVLSFFIVSLHECAHGLTCKHFGGEVHEIGFLLIYFQPALYCNVSDAWLFSTKANRLWVGFAGPYFELFLWSLAVLVWRITDVETFISTLALIVMTTSGIKTLFNFNPFLKLDGYYLLSDYLEVPNLRRKSFRFVGDLLKRLVAGVPSTQTEIPAREKFIYAVYGLVATISSFSVLGYIILTAGGALYEKGGPLLALTSTALLGVKFRRRFRRMFSSSSDLADPTDDGDVATSSSSRGEKPASRRATKRRIGLWIRRVILAGIVIALGCFAWFGRAELRIAGPFTIVPKDTIDVRSAVEGIIDTIYVDEGDTVQVDRLVARLSDKDLRADLSQTNAQIRETTANLRLLQAGPTDKEIDVAKAAVTKSEDRLRYAHSREERARLLFEERLRPRNEYEDTKELVALANNELTEARSRLNVLLSGSRPEEIEAANAQLERLQEKKLYIEQQLRLLNVVSPASGIVATPTRQLKELRHALVRKGDPILKVYSSEVVTAQIFISEKEIEGVRVGQTVVLRARAYPDKEFHGRVTSIAETAQGSSGLPTQTSLASTNPASSASNNKGILVSTEIENSSLLLKSEMTGHAKIYCGQNRVADLIRRRLERTFKVEFWSWW